MTGILDLTDRPTDGLCPCGADPRPGSPYCSWDCEPTHIPRHSHLPVASRFTLTPEQVSRLTHTARTLTDAFAALTSEFKRAAESLTRLRLPGVPPASEPDHPLARMNARRQNVTHGPQRAQRPPRQLRR
ncbi:hypothetical protein GCM10010172_06520 [Paractinoplanes ferrugineus]|uniref:Uncharacterized protein n=1 Tax=Paractinoplanes ferrugineus TaxID=113564 RepID=A0A919ML03_9ACTN|nr:hypothetical protein Afe05nite_81600 [Actinoplanes ferrugineus]